MSPREPGVAELINTLRSRASSNGSNSLFNLAADALTQAAASEGVLAAALERARDTIMNLRANGNFENGVTDQTGTRDEGDIKTGDFVDNALTVIRAALASRSARAKLIGEVMIGGNHLANVLIGKLGGDFATRYPPTMPTPEALEAVGPDWFDVWTCWAAIMRTRAALDSTTEDGNG